MRWEDIGSAKKGLSNAKAPPSFLLKKGPLKAGLGLDCLTIVTSFTQIRIYLTECILFQQILAYYANEQS